MNDQRDDDDDLKPREVLWLVKWQSSTQFIAKPAAIVITELLPTPSLFWFETIGPKLAWIFGLKFSEFLEFLRKSLNFVKKFEHKMFMNMNSTSGITDD